MLVSFVLHPFYSSLVKPVRKKLVFKETTETTTLKGRVVVGFCVCVLWVFNFLKGIHSSSSCLFPFVN